MKLHSYQKQIVKELESGRNLCLSVGMGLGKTISTLAYLDQLQPDSLLIIAPKRVAETVWVQEAKKWDLLLYEKMIIVKGSRSNRLSALNDDRYPYKVIGRDNIKDLIGFTTDVLVLDELTSFKGYESMRTKVVLSIAAKQKIGLTGTVAPNGAIDLYSQMAAIGLCDPEGFWGWRGSYFIDTAQNPRWHRWELRKELSDCLRPWLGNIISLRSEDYLEIPPVSYHLQPVQLSAQERHRYTQLSATCMVEVDDLIYDVKEQAKFAKLQTAAGGFIYNEDHEAVQIGTSKYDAVVDFICRCKGEGEPVLLFYAYIHEANYLRAQLAKRGLVVANAKAGNAIAKWNNKEVDVLIAHPASAGHGLNLQGGGRILVWSSVTWNYEYYAQANARLARQGQEKAVQIHCFYVPDTVEDKMLKALDNRETINSNITNIIES